MQHLSDEIFMKAAVELSSTALGSTLENPAVGAILVWRHGKETIIIGRGTTAITGRPHAETQAIAEAMRLYGAKAVAESTLYVTLEPCAHYGKTPPCALSLIKAKVKRVVVALCDIDPRVDRHGIQMLREAGIEVTTGILSAYAYNVMSRYFINQQYKRCEVTLKLALAQNAAVGQIGVAKFNITNALAKKIAHKLRSKYDAILIGLQTALLDDPILNCRLNGLEKCSPIRIVLDVDLKLPLHSQLVATARQQPLWIACSATADSAKKQALQDRGAELLEFMLPQKKLIDLEELVARLYHLNIFSLLVEGGANVATNFLAADLVDRLALFTSPVIVEKDPILAPNLQKIIASDNYRLIEKMSLNSNKYEHWIRTNKCLQG